MVSLDVAEKEKQAGSEKKLPVEAHQSIRLLIFVVVFQVEPGRSVTVITLSFCPT
jgi:hypothetical protein